MELADYWLLEKQLVHKLFKVLVPRFENCPVSYTRMYRAPRPCPGPKFKRAVLELRGEIQKSTFHLYIYFCVCMYVYIHIQGVSKIQGITSRMSSSYVDNKNSLYQHSFRVKAF
jgi:hypothetical protein